MKAHRKLSLLSGLAPLLLSTLFSQCKCNNSSGERPTSYLSPIPQSDPDLPLITEEMIQWAIKTGENFLANVLWRLKQGETIDINERKGGYNANTQQTALHRVAKMGDLAILRALLARGADVNLGDDWGVTPLHIAAKKGHIAIVQELLKCKDIDVNTQDEGGKGDTPLHKAVDRRHVEVIKALLAYTAIDVNVKPKGEYGLAPLHLAVDGSLVAFDIATLQILLSHKNIDVNLRTKKGYTALLIAVDEGNLAAVRALLSHKAIDVNISDRKGETPLHVAVEKENETLVKALLHKGARIDIKSHSRSKYEGKTPLALAVNTNIRKLLLEAQQP